MPRPSCESPRALPCVVVEGLALLHAHGRMLCVSVEELERLCLWIFGRTRLVFSSVTEYHDGARHIHVDTNLNSDSDSHYCVGSSGFVCVKRVQIFVNDDCATAPR